MSKARLNLSVNHDLVQQAKEACINLSELMEEAIKIKMGKVAVIDIAEIRKDLADNIKRSQILLNDIDDKVKKLELKILEKDKWFKEIPELQGLEPKQITDTKFLMGLIDMIRTKYNIRIGITDIQEHYGVNYR